jgi:uncharacterized membrane protein YraQ (UPF0718 family)
MIFTYLEKIAVETYHVLLVASPYILFGFLAAGFLYVFFPQEKVQSLLGRKSLGSIIKAALLGIPLPLCSCGVVPAAIALRRRGASRGATASFLISTPETGMESIALTYGLLGWLMTIVRPVAAFITSTVAGILVNTIDKSTVEPVPAPTSCCCAENPPPPPGKPSVAARITTSFRQVFDELLGDIGHWLLLGIVISGAILAFLPDGFLEENLGSSWATMLLMLVIGLPLYICASASTPVAAALMLKGISPGAALVLLMVGPATNISTMIVVSREMGKKSAVAYVGSIIVCSLLIATAVDFLVAHFQLSIDVVFSPEHHFIPAWVGLASTVILLALIGNVYRKKFLVRKPAPTCGCEH